MKSSHLIFLAIYVLGMVFGFRVGNNLKRDESLGNVTNLASMNPTSIPTLKNGQHNLLVVTIDDMAYTRPQLKSIWLVTYFNHNKSVSFLPVYPTISKGKLIADDEYSNKFELISTDGQYKLSPKFLDTLIQRNFWWSTYLILDQEAYSSLLESTDQILPFAHVNNKTQNNQAILDSNKTQESIYTHDVQVIREICYQIAQEEHGFDWESFRDLSPHYISSDINFDKIINNWIASLSSNGTLQCNFPLEMVTP